MKKFLSVFLAALMLLSLCACGTQKAEKTMRTFCDGMKEYDFEKMQACLVPSAGSIQAKIGEMEGGEEAAALLYAKMKEWAAKMTYEIVSVNEEGDHATATVKYYYVDASPILQDVLGEYYLRDIYGNELILTDAVAGADGEFREVDYRSRIGLRENRLSKTNQSSRMSRE